MDIRPEYANIEKDNELIQIDPSELKVGDILKNTSENRKTNLADTLKIIIDNSLNFPNQIGTKYKIKKTI